LTVSLYRIRKADIPQWVRAWMRIRRWSEMIGLRIAPNPGPWLLRHGHIDQISR